MYSTQSTQDTTLLSPGPIPSLHPSISMEKKLSCISWELWHTAGKFSILTEHASLTQISAGCAASTSHPGAAWWDGNNQHPVATPAAELQA